MYSDVFGGFRFYAGPVAGGTYSLHATGVVSVTRTRIWIIEKRCEGSPPVLS